jgi:hypothetical protein
MGSRRYAAEYAAESGCGQRNNLCPGSWLPTNHERELSGLGQSARIGPTRSTMEWSPVAPRARLLALQRTAGNRAVGGLLRAVASRAARPIGPAAGAYEREAERVAGAVMRSPAPAIRVQRSRAQRSSAEDGATSDNPSSYSTAATHLIGLRSAGQPLPRATRAFFEPRLGHDFGQVRVHTDLEAAASARALYARAYTAGRDIVFGAGHYEPGTGAGDRLLAHELVHIIQNGSAPPRTGVSTGPPSATGLTRLSRAGTSYVFRAPLDVGEIMADIQRGISTHPDLFSWLHVMGERSGDIAHAAACPGNSCPARRPARPSAPDPAPVPLDHRLPIIAHFFPSYIRHTDRRALIVGGFHGDEKPGYEMVDALVQELQQNPRVLGFHTLIIPRLNRGAIKDHLAGVNWYDHRCNRQVVDLNRNLPVPGAGHASGRCANTATAPVQPETQGLVDVIRDFQPHRILSAHAISTRSSAGIFADPNTHPTAAQLACSLAGRLLDPRDRPANRLRGDRCNAVYPLDRPGELPADATFGRYAPTGSIPGQTIPVITVEAPGYQSLGTGQGARTRQAYLRPLLSFIGDPAGLADADAAIVRDIAAFSIAERRLFLTGRLPVAHQIYGRIERRVQDALGALNSLRPRPPNPVTIVSHRRMFADPVSRASPQSKIVFEKFTLTGSKDNGWDTLPDRFFLGGVRSRGVDRSAWFAEPSASRLAIILRFSAVPGASRHHWGTDVDFNSTTNADWGATTGRGGRPGRFHRLGVWLEQNAPRVGFVKAYTAGRTGGHSEEAWHYSYAPIAVPLRTLFNREVRLSSDIVDPILADWTARASRAHVTLPNDLGSALRALNLSTFVDVIGPGL